ncbi:MAG: tripartite tricarboxylate transporter permease [Syntrophales bacterium LBB04]|nr:tripartite tricarboxylate transporter permease [Syntrophales bacterium LBB04]
MAPVSGIIMLSGIYYGAMYGGTITSVLINTPGEAASMVTCLDGYQMARQGRAGTALGVAAIGSFIGGTVAVIGLTFIAIPLSRLALTFGPPEYFSLMLFALMMMVGLMGKSLLRGVIAGTFGFLVALIGMDRTAGEIRFVFGMANLINGIDLIAVLMGLFGISEILLSTEEEMKREQPAEVKSLLPAKGEWAPTMKAVGRGTAVGFFLGLIPGLNAVIASLMSYSLEKRIAKDPSRFGKGAIEGVAGPETANNALAGAAVIPLFTLGIPSSPTMAVLFGAFMLHGLTPGPRLFEKNPDLVWAVIASMYVGNVMLLIMNLPLARIWAKVALVPYRILYPFILIFCVLGAYTINNQLWDVGVMIVFGIIGYFMRKLDMRVAATVLAFVLGQQIEMNLVQSLILSRGSLLIFLRKPVSAGILVCLVIVLILSIYSRYREKRAELSSEISI